jgi:membrane protein
VAGEGKPGLVDRLRARYGWFDRVMRANQHYDDCNGNFFAAALSYYTVFALFPLLMVGFSVGGFVLSRRPDVLDRIEQRVNATVPGKAGQQLITLIDSAIESHTSVGIIGLGVAGWAGLAWMAKLREALSGMWERRYEKPGFVRAKLSDLVAMVWAFLAVIVLIVLTAVGDRKLLATVLGWLGVPDSVLLSVVLWTASLAVSLVVSWSLFTWMIARLPREPVSLTSSMRAGVIAAVGFALLKQVGAIYLQSVVGGPAGAVFGPVLGLLVFAYITARLILFSTAWAATSPENLRSARE